MQLETYLLDRGVVTAEQVGWAFDRQRESRPPLGSLAIAEAALSPRDVITILHWQQAETPRRFGEIAIGLGYLSEDEVERLLSEQARQTLSLADALVELGLVDEAICREASAELERLSPTGRSRHI